MPANNTVTGRHGKFQVGSNQVARTTQWAVNKTLATTSEWGDSDSYGYTNRAIGRRDGTFTAEGKFDTTDPQYTLFAIGDDYISATLWMGAGNTGAPFDTQDPDPALTWHFPSCICTDFNLTVDMDTEEVIAWTGSFGADGHFWEPGQTTQFGGVSKPDAGTITD